NRDISRWESARPNEHVDLGEQRGTASRCTGQSENSAAHCRQDRPKDGHRSEEIGEHRRMRKIWKEFKEFAIKGNAVDLAVGVIIGAAFTGIINSLVKDIIMPPLSLLMGGLDF